ncbi:MAG: 16S rRNA (cytosine(1402)-N(4))-methyltransferase RsmH [Candidatus Moeniiplasma glomeromycotorum]|nr:16S rRNA (cytosine(1402)-N(4))-methyltransferase RsmH [Candidatus Moeniiplasma glomeromycotorum]MCE8168049.1 16S rRNA (cytosine(1402)-N(4))-methyltransferase RsmH [Candidatus Moeniiplasma glomeromycotorum]MCE8169566.1 16S rRNA (cytosine(1402)-N(4))-methyltransferase RsmH [Candidatus Moeniiplasma glomeromycotorum]
MNSIHQPVMISEVLEHLNPQANGLYVDGTFGAGGHSRVILERLKTGKLIAFEWDRKAVELVNQDKFFSLPQFTLINDNFINFEKHLQALNISAVDGFLLDLGLSSDQLEAENRGFSYRSDSPLDMRMNLENKLTAEEIINHYPEKKLADIFYHYGEETKARLIARKVVYWRKKSKITTTQQLVGIVASCFPYKKKQHPARKVFQALRIYVNQELENLTSALEAVFKYLAKGGKIMVLSYHSLEDRIVKQTFKQQCKSNANFALITKKPLRPSNEEVNQNHRARSAKMRVLTRLN